ncbi:MAG: capsule assembly Wzi family protein, partial [Gemmatimonadaceae bacterium]|nr:capsule assembly Wzi family protein [Gemmatimonadaceae bacterium]
MLRFRLLFLLACSAAPLAARAQREPTPTFDPRDAAPAWRLESVGSEWEERTRLRQLLAGYAEPGFFLRSTSSRLPAWRERARIGALPFVVDGRVNTETPFGPNSGTMSQMAGTNLRLQWGIRAQLGPLRVLAAPEVVSATNQDWRPLNPIWWHPPDQELAGFRPEVPPTNASPWTAPGLTRTPFFIDTPMQFGTGLSQRLTAGQTAVWLERGALAAGYGAENHWWGPGQRNALLLSNNAPSFPAAFVRTARPLEFGWGRVEARYLLGRLTDSRFFRLADSANRRSLSGAVVVVQPQAVPGLSLGAARMVIKQLDLAEPFTRRWADVLQPIGRPNARPLTDFTTSPQRDQLSSLFFHYAAPGDGFEVYGEYGRAEEPINLRDVLVEPNHSQAVTLGLQWMRPVGRRLLRIQWERSFLEQSPTYLNRPMGS